MSPLNAFQTIVITAATVLLPVAASAQSLKGSPESVNLMYTTAHSHDLAFLQTRNDIYDAAMSGALVMLTINDDLTLDRASYPFVLPATKRFADSLAKVYHAACGERLAISSGSRPVDEQPSNASPESVHPTGMAIDIHKPAEPCLTWLRTNLLALENRHVIEATEEHHPPHFHVAVLSQLREPPIRNVMATLTTISNPTVGGKSVTTTTAAGDVALASDRTHQVQAGDNLWTIAERNNTTVEDLEKLNALHGTRLRVGQILKLR